MRAAQWGGIAAWSGVAFVAAYVLLRLAGAALFPEPNPAVIVSQIQVAYFFRLQTSAYVAVLVGLGLWLTPASFQERAARALPSAIALSASALVAIALLVP